MNFSEKSLITIIIILALLSGLIYFGNLFLINSAGQMEINQLGSLTASKHASALTRINGLLNSYQTDLFNRSAFVQLKPFIALPLEIGQVGKENPFALPMPPEEQLLEQLINFSF